MARKAIIEKWSKTPKYKTRAYTRCRICGRPHAVLKKYGVCRICFRELAYKGEIQVVEKQVGKIYDVTKGGTLNGYDRSYSRFINSCKKC